MSITNQFPIFHDDESANQLFQREFFKLVSSGISEEDANDILQNAALAYLENASSTKSKRQHYAYFYKALGSKRSQFWKDFYKEQDHIQASFEDEYLSKIEAQTNSLEQQVSNNEFVDLVLSCLNHEDQEIIALHISGFTAEEIVVELELNKQPKTVKNRIPLILKILTEYAWRHKH